MQQQMFMLWSLVLVISVLNVSADPQNGKPTPVPTELKAQNNPPDTTLAPITITFTCGTNGLVTDFDISTGNYEKARVLKPNGKYCVQDGEDKPAVLKCVTDSYIKKDEKIIIMYGDEVHNGVIGGKHMQYFSFSCTETSVFKKVTLSPVIQASTAIPKDFRHEISEVPVLSIKSLSASIFVGQSMTLQMSIADQYKIQPESCTAYRTIGDPDAYKFWDRCSILDEAIVPSPAKWVSWTDKSKPKGLKIDMFAFKFIGTENLIIECRTKVCPLNEEQKCKETCAVGRRRRSNDNLLKLESRVQTKTAAITLKVVDNHIGQQNGSQGLTSRWYITIIGLVIICWTSFQG